MRCVRRSARSRNGQVAQVHFAQPLPEPLAALQVQHRTPPRLAVQLEEPFRPERRLPQQMVHVEVRPAARAQARAHLVEVGRARQRRQDREAGLKQLVPLDERPEVLEVALRARPDR